MGIFVEVIGCKGTTTEEMSQGDIFDKRFVSCDGCPATYNSCQCHRAQKLHSLFVVFES